MLIPTYEYLRQEGVNKMSLNEVVAFKDKLWERITYYEENKYTERMLNMELHMHPAPSVHYWWHCQCIIELCTIILTREDCNEEIEEKCVQDINTAHEKIEKDLYNNEKEAFEKYREIKKDRDQSH